MERYLFPKTPDDDGRSDGLTQDQLNELIGRLKGAQEGLLDLASVEEDATLLKSKLYGKVEGVRLALRYIEEITKENHDGAE